MAASHSDKKKQLASPKSDSEQKALLQASQKVKLDYYSAEYVDYVTPSAPSEFEDQPDEDESKNQHQLSRIPSYLKILTEKKGVVNTPLTNELGKGGSGSIYKFLINQDVSDFGYKKLVNALVVKRVLLKTYNYQKKASELAYGTKRDSMAADLAHEVKITQSVYGFGELLGGENVYRLIMLEIPNAITLGKEEIYPIYQTRQACFKLMIKVFTELHLFHRKGLIHLDFDTRNIMLTKEGHIYLIDFNFTREDLRFLSDAEISQLAKRNYHLTLGLRGNSLYIAPEAADQVPAHPTLDIWSAGFLLINWDLDQDILFDKDEDTFEFMDDDFFKGLMYLMLQVNPIKRMSLEKVLLAMHKQYQNDYPEDKHENFTALSLQTLTGSPKLKIPEELESHPVREPRQLSEDEIKEVSNFEEDLRKNPTKYHFSKLSEKIEFKDFLQFITSFTIKDRGIIFSKFCEEKSCPALFNACQKNISELLKQVDHASQLIIKRILETKPKSNEEAFVLEAQQLSIQENQGKSHPGHQKPRSLSF